MKNAFTFDESFAFVLAAGRVRDQVDRELGNLLLSAHQLDTKEAWGAVHDRMNVLGEFDGADSVREMVGSCTDA